MAAQRYPLAWPLGWQRSIIRKAAQFGRSKTVVTGASSWRSKQALTIADAIDRLGVELRRLGVRDGEWLISSDLRTRNDGLPYSQQAQPSDPGVAVYFKLRGKDRVLACDRWTRIADNIAAVAAHVECIRGIDRYGVGTIDQAFAGYAALPPKGHTWRTSLGFEPDQVVDRQAIQRAFKARARTAMQMLST